MATSTKMTYELVLVFTPVLADDEYRAAQKKFSDLITEFGGSISHQEPWGMRTMAYPIQKKTTGLYYLVQYEGPGDLNTKLETQMNRSEIVMRHMITRLDKYALQYNDRRRSKASQKASDDSVAERAQEVAETATPGANN